LNHGCDGSYNTGTPLNVTERTAVEGIGPAANGYVYERGLYNPFLDRIYPCPGCDGNTRALRDIREGEEVLDNYLVFGGIQSGVDWESNLQELKSMCAGGIGSIMAYEEALAPA
jgi:hypothetical protein